MARKIIKQPNGKYCIFSTIVDHFIAYNMTKEEIIALRVAEAQTKITEEVVREINAINDTNTDEPLNYALKCVKENHGTKEFYKYKNLLK
jgi:hypothetical protein